MNFAEKKNEPIKHVSGRPDSAPYAFKLVYYHGEGEEHLKPEAGTRWRENDDRDVCGQSIVARLV